MTIEPWHWGALGLLLLLIEIFTLSFASFWFGISALVTAIFLWFLPMSLGLQIVFWLSTSVLSCVIWFRYIQPKFKTRTRAGLGGASIIGERGLIVEMATAHRPAKVRFSIPQLGASEWACRCLDGELNVGDKVVVINIVGNELIVSK